MAEYGIHHATRSGIKPSIFEVIGQENLYSVLKSAFRHAFKVLGENYPEKFGLMHRYFDEGYIIVDSVFQYVHLRLKGGLFAETFYGLKRFPDPRSTDVSKHKLALWIFLAVVLPYVQSRLENLYKNIQDSNWNSPQNLNSKDVKMHFFYFYIKLYPYFNFVWETAILFYYMAYALGKSQYHSPLMHLTSVTLSHQMLLDHAEDAWKQFIPQSQQKKLSTIVWDYMNIFVNGITLTISLGAFLTQFLNWWYSQEGKNTNFTPLPVPPPPRKWPFDISSEVCPICANKRTNDTALSSSGFVFCYPCIFRFVQTAGKCPVTGYKSSLNQLIKLYHQE